MILDRARLVDCLKMLSTSFGNKHLEVAYYIKFDVNREHSRVFLSTTDFHAYLTVGFGELELTTLDDVPEVFLIDFATFSKIINASTTQSVEMTGDDESIVVTTDGSYRFQCWKEIREFPVNDFSNEPFATWPVPGLQSAWNKAVMAVSDDVTRINYQGVCFDGNFVASDNRRLSVVQDYSPYDGEPLLIPPLFGAILKHCKNEVDVGISEQGKMVLTCNEVGLIAGIRLIDAQFINYHGVLQNRQPMVSMVLPKTALLGALGRLSIFTDKINKLLNMTVNYCPEEGIDVKLSVSNKSAGEEIVDAIDYEDSEMLQAVEEKMAVAEFSYLIDNLEDGVAAVDSADEVTLCIQDDGKLWVDEENFSYLINRIKT